ncbi:MAG: hypothetical protein LC790_02630, partial [Actinobacteria bacterium]|nr:hypothetical protein [Actinomycetota bacterium]
GSVIVGDERVPDEFDPPGDEVERFYYGFSVLHCLPVGMVGDDPFSLFRSLRPPDAALLLPTLMSTAS